MDPNNPYETWQAVIEKVKSYGTVNPAQVDAFLGRMQPQASSVGFLLATVDTDFIKGQIEKRFLSQIEQALRDLFETEYVVEIEVDPGSSAFMQQIATQNAQQSAPYTPPAQPAAPQAAGAQAGAAPIAPAHSEHAAPAPQPNQPQTQVTPQVRRFVAFGVLDGGLGSGLSRVVEADWPVLLWKKRFRQNALAASYPELHSGNAPRYARGVYRRAGVHHGILHRRD